MLTSILVRRSYWVDWERSLDLSPCHSTCRHLELRRRASSCAFLLKNKFIHISIMGNKSVKNPTVSRPAYGNPNNCLECLTTYKPYSDRRSETRQLKNLRLTNIKWHLRVKICFKDSENRAAMTFRKKPFLNRSKINRETDNTHSKHIRKHQTLFCTIIVKA